MPRKPEVDQHPKKNEIIKALVAGKMTYREITQKYGIESSALSRYLNDKLLEKAAKAVEKRDEADGERVVRQIEEIQNIVKSVLDKELADGNNGMVLAAAREFRAGCELLAKIYGKLHERSITNVNITISQAWILVKDIVYQATEGAPEIRERIVNEIDNLNQ